MEPSKVALVTGGNRGIGRGITEALLTDGYAVSILATRPAPPELLEELGSLGPVRYVQGSVDDPAAHVRFVADAIAAWGRVDVLINNAGVAPLERNDILEATPESFDRVLGINLRGPYFLTQLVARTMIERRPSDWDGERQIGTIVNISSVSAEVVSTNRGDYCISKAGVAMGTKLWAVRLAPEGIGVFEVRPGIIATDMTAGVTEKYDAFINSGKVPMPRWGRPADIGSTVRALCSGAMPYTTGEVIHVDGGMNIPTL